MRSTCRRKGFTMESMELANVNTTNLAMEMSQGAASMYCSLKAGTREEKARVFNASNNPTHKVGDFINQVIEVKDVLCEVVNVDGEEAIRTVLIDKNGESYQAVSAGIFSALKKAVQMFGAPTWDEPLPVLIKQVKVGKGTMLTFDVQA